MHSNAVLIAPTWPCIVPPQQYNPVLVMLQWCALPWMLTAAPCMLPEPHFKTVADIARKAWRMQVTLLRQSKVPCLADNSARLALEEENPYEIMTKPHGHGDVHSLLHSTGTARRWARQGLEWVAFFQDTNALVFRGLLPSLGALRAGARPHSRHSHQVGML